MCEVRKVFDIELPSDCAEFCPWDGHRFALGTYFLKDADTQTKEGAVELYTINGLNEDDINRVGRFTTGAVFDLKWLRRDALVMARADGIIEVRRVGADAVPTISDPVCSSPEACGPATYVDCGAYGPDDAGCSKIFTAHSTGNVAVWNAELHDNEEPLMYWHAHDFETWVVTHDRTNPDNLVWSGADDGFLKLWDTRSDSTEDEGPAIELTPLVRKRHDMGVTSITCHATKPLLAVGSYDESLTLWDIRNPSTPLVVVRAAKEATEGGGVWRLKWHRTHQDTLLAACMHVGYRVFQLSEDGTQLPLIEEYHGPHTNLAYGADWMPPVSDIDSNTLVAGTCSFYDKKLSFWSINAPKPL